ncbi:NB-ARC domain-containing protein [Streptomyces sp. NPDC001617]
MIDEPEVACVRVEGPPASKGAADKVDFDVVDSDGTVRLAVQVKSRVAGGSMSGAMALGVLLEMVNGSQGAGSYLLLTNAHPGAKGNRLEEVLASDFEPQALRDTLMELFHDAPQRREQLKRLDTDGLTRLARCRLEYDARDNDEIREELRNCLRSIRNRIHQGLGEQSAGLLTGYLVSEILDRAADVTGERATFSTTELRRLILVDAETLAQSIGARDWGTIAGQIPAIPDVRRPKLVDPLLAAFPASGAQLTRRATLVGPSGIGKSSAAALYIAARADAYDFIGWIDCETRASTLASFHRVLDVLDPNAVRHQEGRPEETQQAVQQALGRLPGRWLLIFDNVAATRQAEPWVPKASRGDVIITTLNAATHLGTGDVVQVSTMERKESAQLLTRRLHLGESDEPQWADALDRLASELGDWPLALELGASYLYTCGLGLDQVDHYLNALKVRSFSDEESVPPGYPRTLAAALNMCVDNLERRIQPGPAPDVAAVGLQMFYAAAYLASHQIPAHLLLAAAISRAEDFDADYRGPVLVAPETVNIGEALRELSRFSLIKNDLPLPPTYGQTLTGADRSISINTVSQELMRERLTRHPYLSTVIDQLAGHVERWLTGPTQLGELERVRVMQSHAEMLLSHIDRLDLPSERAALICGNLAAPYYLQGDVERAEELYTRELDYLERAGSQNEALVVQTRFALAAMPIQVQELGSDRRPTLRTTLADAIEHLEFVLHQARSWVFEYPKAAMKLALDSRLLIQSSSISGEVGERLTRLADAFTDLESRIGPTAYSVDYEVLERAEGCLQDGLYIEAEAHCRALLDKGMAGPLEAEARRRLVEALAGQAKWDEAIGEVNYWKQDPAAPRLFRHAIVDLIRNVCVSCSTALTEGDPGSLRLLDQVVDWPDLDEFISMGTDEDNQAITSARALRDLIRRASRR